MKRQLSIPFLLITQVWWCLGGALAASVPQQPEMDNPEFRLDVATNAYGRWWRESWDAGDNRFRFRLGSNNVTQWAVDEQLKLAADLLEDRLRFRFYHSRIMPYTNEDIGTNVLEFEGRVYGHNYLSVYGRPTSDKREGALGLMLQRRRAVNRYIKISLEWPGFMRNFFEHYRNTSDSLLNVFTDRPVRFGMDVREEIIRGFWIRAVGEYTPAFVMGEEITATGEQFPRERAESKALSGWIEYVVDPSRELRDQTAVGIDYQYQRARKSKVSACGCSAETEHSQRGSAGGDFAVSDRDILAGDRQVACGPLTPTGSDLHEGGGMQHVPFVHFGRDLYQRTDEDTVVAWRDSRWFLAPYAWITLNDRVTFRADVRVGEQEIGIGGVNSLTSYTTNAYVVPLVGVRYSFGRSRAAVLETGWVSEWRTRTEDRTDERRNRVQVRRERFDDHRLYVSFEYVFGDSKVIRLVEAFEMDAEDRGDFAIHDHGFFQVIVGF